MAFSEKEKKRIIALTRALKEEKGVIIKKSELEYDIARFKKGQAEIDKIAYEYADTPAVVKEAEKEKAKLESIIGELNEYMSIIHPEGLLDLGSDGKGQTVVAAG